VEVFETTLYRVLGSDIGRALEGLHRDHGVRMLFNEAPKAMLQGLAGDVARWTKPGKLERNLRKLASDLGAMHGVERWLKSG